jgi:hypothetical protein
MTAKVNTGKETEYSVLYRAVGGVDFNSENNPDKSGRFSYLENMYRDYEGDGGAMLESVVGFRQITRAEQRAPVHAIFSYTDNEKNEQIVFQAGDALYKFPLKERDSSEYRISSPIAYIEPHRASAFSFENSLYVIDGCDITVIDGDGYTTSLTKEPELIYEPTCYVNGEEYEQKNLLTNNFYEIYRIGNCDTLATESLGLHYEIISEEEKTCAVTGAEFETWKPIYIPAYTKIGTESYKVIKVARAAFNNEEKITALVIANGISTIEKNAFRNCANLKSALLPESIEEIGDGAFSACNQLTSLNFGESLKRLGKEVAARCHNLTSVNYSKTSEDFSKIEIDGTFEFTVNTEQENRAVYISIPIFSEAESVNEVLIDGVHHNFTTTKINGRVSEVVIYDEDKSRIIGKEAKIYAIMRDTKFTLGSFTASYEGNSKINGRDAILGCTLCQSFDGRIFLSGNPLLPNTVFYSQRDITGRNNPLYFGILNYFNDGVGASPITSLLAVGDSLAVFKSKNGINESIYYHKPSETNTGILPKVYPVSHIHTGIFSHGDTISFFDEAIFISKTGVVAINDNEKLSGRDIEIRSHAINPKLLNENLCDVRLGSWMGYLVLGAGEHIYLGDSRQRTRHQSGSYEYEWYYLNGIATYTDTKPVYRYSDTAPKGLDVNPKPNEIANGTVYSYYDSELKSEFFYLSEGNKRYAVYMTDEISDGVKHPMSALYTHGEELLIFGTTSGDICIFNNDKRGAPPERIVRKKDFDLEKYQQSFSRKIHSDFYDFAKKAPRYVVRTAMDNVGIPHLTKDTVKNSLTAKIRVYGKTDISFEVKTDKSDYSEICRIPDTVPDFEDFDFSSLSFIASDFSTLAIKEKEKGWIEKQLQISSDKFRAPFGLLSEAYRYTVKGRIKNR